MEVITQTFGMKSVSKHSPNHNTFKIRVHKMTGLPIVRWEHNRPPNEERTEDIVQSLQHKSLPFTFHLSMIFNHKENRLEIIDGLHRYFAILSLSKSLEKTEQNQWFYESTMIIEIKINQTKGEIIDWFQTINNCSPASELYLNSTEDKVKLVEEVVNRYYSNHSYHSHFSGTLKPNIPNTNREFFTDFILHIVDTHNITLETKRKIDEILENLNQRIKKRVTEDNPKLFNKKITKNAMEKCYKTEMFLFLSSKENLFEMVSNYV